MSLRATLWALDQAPTDDPAEVVVLISLADEADDEGRNAWPSQERLATRARCSVRTVQRRLRALEDRGLITRMECADARYTSLPERKRPVCYRLALHLTRQSDASDEVTTTRSDASDGALLTRQSVADNPNPNPEEQEQPVRAAKRGQRIPDPFILSDKMVAFARDRQVVDSRAALDLLAEAFAAHHTAKGTVSKDWEASWRTWCLNDIKFRGRGGGSGTVRRTAVAAASDRAQHDDGRSGAMTGREWLTGVAPPTQEGLL